MHLTNQTNQYISLAVVNDLRISTHIAKIIKANFRIFFFNKLKREIFFSAGIIVNEISQNLSMAIK